MDEQTNPLDFWNRPVWRFWRAHTPPHVLEQELASIDERIKRGDEGLYADYPQHAAISVAKVYLLEGLDRGMPRLEEYRGRGGISELVLAYDTDDATVQRSVAHRLVDKLFREWLTEQKQHRESRDVLVTAVRAHLDGQRLMKREGRLRMMDNGQHTQAEHPLNVAHRMARFGKDVPLAWLITAILHDDNEDVQFPIHRGPVETIIKHNEQRLEQLLGEGNPAHIKQQIRIGVRAIERVTLRRVAEYEMELEHMEHEPHDGENLAIIAAAYATKLNDKGSAVVTTDYLGRGLFGWELRPIYTPLNEMSQHWKALSSSNLARKSLQEGALSHAPLAHQALIRAMSVQTALDLWKTSTTQLDQAMRYCESCYHLMHGDRGVSEYRAAIVQNTQRCNEYIRRGGITHIDTDATKPDALEQEFGKLFFFLRLHKMNPKRKTPAMIPPLYRREAEAPDDLINRLERDLARFRGGFPYTTIQRFTERLFALPADAQKREFGEEMPLYLKLDKRQRSIRQVAQRFALNSNA
ncbi:hypothetical protein D6789_04245, partial [Candidatus Woesearchaeota archaeon]